MTKPKLALYYDIASPFAYFAYFITRTSPVFFECELTYTPILLGGLFKTTGNRAPMTIKNKDKWGELERKRWAKMYNIPVADEVPEGFPLSTLLIQRALTAVTLFEPDKLLEVTDALYAAFWEERNVKKINEPEGLRIVLAKVLGEEKADQVMSKCSSDDVKKELNKRTQQAFDDGAFGVPHWVATNSEGQAEIYWGFDHLGQILDHLGLERPQTVKGWRAML